MSLAAYKEENTLSILGKVSVILSVLVTLCHIMTHIMPEKWGLPLGAELFQLHPYDYKQWEDTCLDKSWGNKLKKKQKNTWMSGSWCVLSCLLGFPVSEQAVWRWAFVAAIMWSLCVKRAFLTDCRACDRRNKGQMSPAQIKHVDIIVNGLRDLIAPVEQFFCWHLGICLCALLITRYCWSTDDMIQM